MIPMRYCKKCVQPDTRPGIQFDETGVCLPCRFHEELDHVDWAARRKELEAIAAWGRQHNVSGYDCIIGVSGGKDSTRQAVFAKEELGLKPLLVCCTYPPEQITERGARNISNLICLGFDCITVSPDPKVWRKLMLQGILNYGNWCKSTEMALYASAPKVAIAYHIPLIFLGENPAIRYGEIGGSLDGDANAMKYCHTLEGGNPDNLLTEDIREQDTISYRYPTDDEMEWAKLRVVYLGYYIKDFISFKNAEFSVRHGLEIRNDPPEDIGEAYGFEALDDDFVVVNQMLKYLKFGFGKMTDLANDAIRMGMMTRQEAVRLCQKLDGKCANRYVEGLCDYLGISEEKFWEEAERFRNRQIWEKNGGGEWRLKTPLKSFDP